MIIILICGLIVMVLNVLDSTTTELGFRQYPDKELRGESNPIMRKLMLKKRWLAEVVKQGGVFIPVMLGILQKDVAFLRLMAIMLGLVVLNNSYIVIVRAVTHREVRSPFKLLQDVLHISDKWMYVVVVIIIVALAYTLNLVIFGGIP